jgi:AraC-like DNA-binding protein
MTDYVVTLPGVYITRLCDLAEDSGINPEGWLMSKGLSHFSLDDIVSVPWQTFYELLIELEQVSKEVAIGLAFGQRLSINTHGNLGFAIMSCSTIREAATLLKTYLPLRTNLLSLALEEEQGHFKITFSPCHPLEDVERIVLQGIVLAIKNIFDFITIGQSDIQEVAFPFSKDKDDDLARSLFKCPIHYQQHWTGFKLPLHKADKTLKMANSIGFNQALHICEAELKKLAAIHSYSAELRKLIYKSITAIPSLEVAAQQLYLTPRTLHRRLIAEGTSYKTVVDEVRHSLALKYLELGHMSIQEIAYALDYSDTANFRRAFRRWQSVSPSAFKNNA